MDFRAACGTHRRQMAHIGGLTGLCQIYDSIAGPAVYLADVGVIPEARRRGGGGECFEMCVTPPRPHAPNVSLAGKQAAGRASRGCRKSPCGVANSVSARGLVTPSAVCPQG